MSDTMHEFARNTRFVLRRAWTWWETYLIIICLILVLSTVVGGSVKQEVIRSLERQLDVIKLQNENSIKDRTFLHEELKNTRDSLHRLESRVRIEESH